MFRNQLIYFVFTFLFFLSSCSKEDRREVKQTVDSASQILGHELDTIINTKLDNDSLFKSAPVEPVNSTSLKSKEFRSALNDIFDKYEDIKDELSDDDTAGVKNSAEEFKKTLLNTVKYAPAADMDNSWKMWVSTTEKIVSELSAAKTLSIQRKGFSELTGSMESMIKNFGLDNRTVYKLTCTAIPGKSFWLTESRSLDNPYSGNDTSNGKDEKCIRVAASWKFE